MPVENRQISSGAITDTKVSKNAGIKGSKLEVAEPGQILVADDKGRFQPQHVDFDKCCDKELPDDVLRSGDLQDGKIFVGGPDGVPVQIPAVTNPERVVKTNPGGTVIEGVTINIEDVTDSEETKDDVAGSDLEQTPSITTDGSDANALIFTQTSQTRSVNYLIFETPDPPGTTKQYQFTHDLGYIPDVRVMEHSTNSEIDAEVSVDKTYATVKLSDSGTRLRVLVQ